MTLDELITDLNAAGANENTIRLAMNCYALGVVREREACAKLADSHAESIGTVEDDMAKFIAAEIRARGQQ